MFWWGRWPLGPVGGIFGHCALQSLESVEPKGEGESGKRMERHLVLPLPHPPRRPPPEGAGGEEPCDRPEEKVAPLHSRYHPARICKQGQDLEREENNETMESEQ